jgi:ribonuclease HI
MNFNGASKGNLIPTGYGVVLRGYTGKIMYILVRRMGHDSKKLEEICGIIRGIQLSSILNMNHLIIEGDSRVIISLATKIINGTDPEKVSLSWHLLGPLETLCSLLCPSLTLIPSHVQQGENKVVDRLANEGVSSQEEGILGEAHHHLAPQKLLQCKEIALKYLHPWDGVTSGTHAPGVFNTPYHHPSSSPLLYVEHSIGKYGSAPA